MKPLAETTIAVVGLGLMGGSLAGALRGRCRSVVGVARRPESVKIGLAHKLIDRGSTDLEDGVRRADVVILATPVRVILKQLTEVGALLPNDCLLIDLGSTKAHIVAAMAHLPSQVQPLGAHPMCGREDSGIEAADPGLFRDHVFVLTPLARTSKEAVTLGCDLVEAVGAQSLILDPDGHMEQMQPWSPNACACWSRDRARRDRCRPACSAKSARIGGREVASARARLQAVARSEVRGERRGGPGVDRTAAA